jgi:DNA-directed RNA polymerase subunit H (RpoH/RPB5)
MNMPVEDKMYSLYYNDVGKHPLLTAEEERELFKRYHTCPHCGDGIL